jgi:very-short-patch-repair endonuclease
VDCLWPDQRVVVELDGGQHDRPHQADVDRRRDLWLRAHGCTVRRYGHSQLVDQPADVIADLLEALGG